LQIKDQQLHERALMIARKYRACESEMIQVLQELDRTKLFKKWDCSSLFVYAVKYLGLDEAVAYSFITVARKAREVPQLQHSLQAQKLSVAKANRIVSALTADNAGTLVDFAEKHSTPEINREVSRLRKGLPERTINLQVSLETLELIKRAKTLTNKNLDQTLQAVLNEYLHRHDPVRKAERAVKRKTELCTNRVRKTKRQPLTAEQKHQVFARDQGRCTHIDRTGERCRNERFLAIHHVRPVSEGGGNDPSNLTTLCGFHHDLAHQLSFPVETHSVHTEFFL